MVNIFSQLVSNISHLVKMVAEIFLFKVTGSQVNLFLYWQDKSQFISLHMWHDQDNEIWIELSVVALKTSCLGKVNPKKKSKSDFVRSCHHLVFDNPKHSWGTICNAICRACYNPREPTKTYIVQKPKKIWVETKHG